jgi:hypothetical protein
MNIMDKMKMDAAGIHEALLRGEKISKADMKFLNSFLNINTKKAPNAGKRKTSPKKQRIS